MFIRTLIQLDILLRTTVITVFVLANMKYRLNLGILHSWYEYWCKRPVCGPCITSMTPDRAL